ncbi:MAG: ATP-binding protein [Actinomycetota bacterium]
MIKRLLAGYVAIVLVVAGALAVPFGIVFAERQREQFAVALERDAVVLATIYEDALQHDLEIEPLPADTYAQRTGVRVVVVDADGDSVVDTGDVTPRTFSSRPEIEAALGGERFTGTRYSSTLQAGLFVVAVPVASGTQIYGAVRLTVFNDDVEDQVQRMWLSLGLVVIVAVGATAVVAFAVARSVTRPIARLGDAAELIAQGDLSARAQIADAPAELAELAATFNDMAERVESLVESQRSFVADASHQLRTPLTALRLKLENLEADASGEELDAYGDLVVEVERLSLLVDQLLELAREGSASTIQIDVADLISQRVSLWEPVAREQSISLELRIDESVSCDAVALPGALEQILDNLIDNALRYTPGDRACSVVASTDDRGRCRIEVADSGPGVPVDHLDRIFDRFWRGDSDEPGTGLGLAICAHLVRQSGGTITATNVDGGGLSVVVTLASSSVDVDR